ncbi:hypothetical protein GN244_ATG15436 [Phytophthora infestans]|uniref:Uncharacterized protein n=1 Tax=Phytophthora infestans TaxID=4787 RepID=A0A833SSV7_PHYIN|nr:hypothetical protein GN244_ATG15436 [Phytophthora infestans]KAF4138310.1 hypothetical protein GN958_ATG12464 [Phytophthora infestans]
MPSTEYHNQCKFLSPEQGFKHLGIYQGGEDQWAASLESTWQRIVSDTDRVQRLGLSLPGLRYVVIHIWIPRLRYRMVLGGFVDVAAKVDIFIRQVARSVLRLPLNVNTAVFYDKENGLGLENCEADANTYHLVEALRILNSPSLPVRHLLIECLKAYQTRAGLTWHPLTYPITPPRGARSWTAQLIRHAASFDPPLTMAVEWTQPLQSRSSRSNDRPLIDYTPSEQQCSLVAINWKAAFKLRYVGDISNVSGTQSMKLPELMRKGHWSVNDRITLESMYDHWVEALMRPDTNRLRSPVGCTPVELGSTPFQLRIGVGQWIVVVKMNSNGTEPVIDHYEIGYREIGDVGSHPLGHTIPIRWWYERPRGSGVFYERRHRVVEAEFEAVCVPISPTYLPTMPSRRQRVIIWDLTVVDGKHGVNNDEVLDEALARSRMRYLSVIHHGHTLQNDDSLLDMRPLPRRTMLS